MIIASIDAHCPAVLVVVRVWCRTAKSASAEFVTVVLRLFFGDRGSGRNMVPNSLS